MYEPVSSVTALRLAPVAVCVAVTSTPGRSAPVWSFTEPLIWAVACAQIIVAPNDIKRTAESAFAPMLIDFHIIDCRLIRFPPTLEDSMFSFCLGPGAQ